MTFPKVHEMVTFKCGESNTKTIKGHYSFGGVREGVVKSDKESHVTLSINLQMAV